MLRMTSQRRWFNFNHVKITIKLNYCSFSAGFGVYLFVSDTKNRSQTLLIPHGPEQNKIQKKKKKNLAYLLRITLKNTDSVYAAYIRLLELVIKTEP